MQNYVALMIDFVRSIFISIFAYFQGQSTTIYQLFSQFLQSQIISGDLINIPLTYQEFFMFLFPIFCVYFSIYLFIKFVCSLLRVIKF